MMLKIGITGGIGSGKSTVCKVFEILGIPVFYADEAAKTLMAENEEMRKALTETFGSQTFHTDGSLNRQYLSKLVFSKPQELEKLNQIVHPAVFKAFDDWVSKQKSAYVVKEAALLFESGSHRLCDLNVLVQSPDELKINRIMKRDRISREEVLARMAKQMTDIEKIPLADYLLQNDEKQLLIPQIVQLHQKFIHTEKQQ